MKNIAAHLIYMVILSATISAGIALVAVLIAQWHSVNRAFGGL